MFGSPCLLSGQQVPLTCAPGCTVLVLSQDLGERRPQPELCSCSFQPKMSHAGFCSFCIQQELLAEGRAPGHGASTPVCLPNEPSTTSTQPCGLLHTSVDLQSTLSPGQTVHVGLDGQKICDLFCQRATTTVLFLLPS